MKRGIGSHHATKGEFDTWLTPQAIINALGPFDLDPCAAPSPRPWPTAARHIELPEDGLAAEWEGRIWLNPPYGHAIKAWMEKMSQNLAMAAYAKALIAIPGETSRGTLHMIEAAKRNGLQVFVWRI